LITDAGEESPIGLGDEQPELKLAVRGNDATLVLLPLKRNGQQRA